MQNVKVLSVEEVNCRMVELSVFSTELGWFGLVGRAQHLIGVRIGHTTAAEVEMSVAESLSPNEGLVIDDWNADLRQRLQDFAIGKRVAFGDVVIWYEQELPPFRREVIRETRKLSYGQRASYQELAARAGSPQAARAVGNTMATNRFPIIVPCHRVLGAGGKLGGFTAPGGLDLKRTLLKLES